MATDIGGFCSGSVILKDMKRSNLAFYILLVTVLDNSAKAKITFINNLFFHNYIMVKIRERSWSQLIKREHLDRRFVTEHKLWSRAPKSHMPHVHPASLRQQDTEVCTVSDSLIQNGRGPSQFAGRVSKLIHLDS